MNRYRHLPTYRYYPEEGYPLNLEKSVGKDLRNYKIHGNSLNGENLFVIKSSYTYSNAGITMTAKTGDSYFTLNGKATSSTSGRVATNLGSFEAGEYSVSVAGLNPISSITDRILVADASTGTVIINNITVNSPQTFVLAEDTELRIQYVIANGSTYENKKIPVTITKVPSIEKPVEILSVGDKTSNLLDFDAMEVINATDTALRGGWIFEFGEDIDITITHDSPEELPIGILLAKKVTDGVYGGNIQLQKNTNTISLTSNQKLLVFVGAATTENSYNMLARYGITKIKLEKGNVATEYEPYGYKIPIKARGKNLLKLPVSTLVNREVTCNVSDNNVVSFEGMTTGYPVFTYNVLNVPANTSVTFSCNVNDTKSVDFRLRNSVTEEYIVARNGQTVTPTFDVDRFQIALYKNIDYTDFEINNIQLELGNTATDYEPYVKPVTTNIYLNEPLRKVNDYKDYIDFKNQKVVRKIIDYTSSGNDAWSFASNNTDTVSFYMNAYNITGYGTTGNTNRLNVLSNKLITKNLTDIECVKCTGNVIGKTNGLVNITLLKSRIGYEDTDTNVQAVEKLKTWLSSNPINFIWCINEFAEPIEEEITLPTIPTHKGTTIIEVDTTIEPTLQVQYYK